MNKDGDLPGDEDWARKEEHTTYTGDISVADDGRFAGQNWTEGDHVEGDQYNGDVYPEPEYEYPVNDRDTLVDNATNWLLGLFSEELIYHIYEKVDSLPLRAIMVGYGIIAGGTSIFTLISDFSLGFYVYLLFIPILPILVALIFKLQLELYSCPLCGPFTVRKEKMKIVGKPLLRVDYTCSDCGRVVDSELYELESQNHNPSR